MDFTTSPLSRSIFTFDIDRVNIIWRTTTTSPPHHRDKSTHPKKHNPQRNLWNERYQQLQQYKRQHGNCLVPQYYNENPSLGFWVRDQRQEYKKYSPKKGKSNVLSSDKIQTLNQIGFVWEPMDDLWEERFRQLKEFKHQYGHCNIPQHFTENPELGRWVNEQRKAYKTWKKKRMKTEKCDDSHNMMEKRIERLQEEDFIWDAQDAAWQTKLQEFRKYKLEHDGDVFVSQNHGSLGKWVHNQRTEYRKFRQNKLSSMTPEKIKSLNDEGFVWNVQEYKWYQKYKTLVEYKMYHGHLPKKSHAIGVWMSHQRRQYELMKKGETSSMTKERVDALEQIGFDFSYKH